MHRFILHRALWIVPTLLVIALVTFVLMHLTPGGPFDREGRQVAASVEEALRRRYHLDRPYWQQFILYIVGDPGGLLGTGQRCPPRCGVLSGDFGPSYQQRGRTVTDILFAPPSKERPIWDSRFGYSARLGLIAFGWSVLVAVPLGIVAALNHNRRLDYVTLFFATFFAGTPSFVLAIFLIVIFGLWLHWLPIVTRDWSNWRAWVLPAFSLGIPACAFLTRLTRATMLEVLRQDYMRTARAKGLAERIVLARHGLRNSLIPVATVLGPSLASVLLGSLFVETMFSFPGMGRQHIQSISSRDYSMILGITLLYAFFIVLANLAVDVVYAWLDPRISYEGRS